MPHDLLPQGDALRNAIRWISEMSQEHPERGKIQLIDEAGRRFDLSPKDQMTLMRYLVEKPAEERSRES